MEADYSILKVLVIGNQQIARQFERGVLGSMGIEQVVEAASGREALQAVTARGAAFDLILRDLRVPGQDGIETIPRAPDARGRIRRLAAAVDHAQATALEQRWRTHARW